MDDVLKKIAEAQKGWLEHEGSGEMVPSKLLDDTLDALEAARKALTPSAATDDIAKRQMKLYDVFIEARSASIGDGSRIELGNVQNLEVGLFAVFTEGYTEGYSAGRKDNPRFQVKLEVKPLKHTDDAQLWCRVHTEGKEIMSNVIASGSAWAIQEFAEGRSNMAELEDRIMRTVSRRSRG